MGSSKIERIFQQLLWPAVAGNVAWSIFFVFFSSGTDYSGYGWRVLSLLLLAAYLVYGWISFDRDNKAPSYWTMDGLHLATIAAFAVATAENHPKDQFLLTLLLGIAAVGHIIGSFDRSEAEHTVERFKRAGANAAGIAVLWIVPFITGPQPWLIPGALALVLVTWWLVKGF